MIFRLVKPSTLVLSTVLLLSLTLSTYATSGYLAGVSPGNYANYVTVKAVFHSSTSLIPEPQFVKDLNATVVNKVTVQTVSSPAANVTASSYTVFTNRPSTLSTVFGDLETGRGNLTFGLIAGGLSYPEPIWNNATAPTINETTAMNFLGATRTVNVLNMTKTFTMSGFLFSTKEYYVWDQASGIAFRVIGSGTFTSNYGDGYFNVEVAISDTNIFTTQSQDFEIATSLNSIIVPSGAKAAATITVAPLYGFSGDTLLSTSISPSYGLSCTLSPATITGGSGSSTLSCTGSPGTYTVTITASSGSLSHTKTVSVSVASVAPPSSAATSPTIFGLAPIIFYGIIGAIALVVIAGVAVIAIRTRRPYTQPPVPSWSPAGPTTSP